LGKGDSKKFMQYPILENQRVSHNYFLLCLDISETAKPPKPGQFYNLRCGETKDPLLRRPFSMHRLLRGKGSVHFEILYRVTGKGTKWLSRRKKGEFLDAIGPFGNGFFIEQSVTNAVLVARGIGIAPLYAVGEAFQGITKETNVFILMGARIKERLFYEEQCKRIGEIFPYTDDGSRGFQGRAPELLVDLMRQGKLPRKFTLYACGPADMLRELADISESFGFSGQVALEGHMGCGFGVCLSCACPLRPERVKRNEFWKKPALQWSEDGSRVYSLICKDGPIYDIREVDWDEWCA
jgi:dihydroorotate dehydrogenase electron transfer subunit